MYYTKNKKFRCGIPCAVGIDGARMETALCLAVVEITMGHFVGQHLLATISGDFGLFSRPSAGRQ